MVGVKKKPTWLGRHRPTLCHVVGADILEIFYIRQ